MTRTVNIEVYCDTTDGERDLFGLLTEHRSDLPNPIDEPLQKWVQENFDLLDSGENITDAGELEYEPDGEIVEFRKK